MRLLIINIILFFSVSCGGLGNKQNRGNPVYVAAKEAKFLNDEQLKSRLDDINKKIVSAKYIESLMVGRTSVSVAEIDNFYEKIRSNFQEKAMRRLCCCLVKKIKTQLFQ